MAFNSVRKTRTFDFEPEKYQIIEGGKLELLDDHPEDLVVLKLRTLDGQEQDDFIMLDGINSALKAFEIGIEGWENFKEDEFSKEIAMKAIPSDYKLIAGQKIINESRLSAEKTKN